MVTLRQTVLVALLAGCGARSELDVPRECPALSVRACTQLSVQIPRTLLADDAVRWPRFVPHGGGLDFIIGDPRLGQKDIARQLRVGAAFDVGTAVVIDDFAGCPLAATANRLGALCGDDVMLYDDGYRLVAQPHVEPSSGDSGTFAATSTLFHVAWNEGSSLAFATVDESGRVTRVASPFRGDYLHAMLTTTTCDGMVRSATAPVDDTRANLEVELASGVVSMAVAPAPSPEVPITEWPYLPHAVVYAVPEIDGPDAHLYVVGENGGRALAKLPTRGADLIGMIPMPWGLALLFVGARETATVEVVDASGSVTASLTLPPIASLLGGFGWARSGGTLVFGWGEPTGTYAVGIGCAGD